MKQYKLGHQAPIGFRVNNFNSIEINGDFAYCKSHDFVYQPEVEKEKLYNGQPCYYTDNRFIDGSNFYENCYIHWTRRKNISLKSCIRKALKCKNIPKGAIITFNKDWYYPKRNFSGSFNFIVKKENKLDFQFEINDPKYFKNFTNCEFSKTLTNKLRENGFIVGVEGNESFLGNMLNSAIAYTGKDDFQDTVIEGEIAIAYGHGKKIGFSSFDNDFMSYSNGCSNILWDRFGEFCKWSRCNEISKESSIDEIIEILIKPNFYGDTEIQILNDSI